MKKSLEDSLVKSKTFANVPIKEIKAPSDNVLEIVLSTPFSGLPAYMAKGESGALSPDCIDQGDITRPIGTGPFIFESFTPKEEIRTVKNPNYWGKVPSVDGVVYTSIPDAVTRSMMLQSGEIDISLINPPEITEKFQAMGGFTVKDQPIHRVRILAYNCDEGPFTDKLIRQAMNYAIDR
jgi:peptide/nickel transport system substrate-binding protein